MISGKKIFITGGAGFLGRNIIKRYYEKSKNKSLTTTIKVPPIEIMLRELKEWNFK
jgi:nucleoside-diphosphate-sugar epimerase